jgi:hypothetical protein
MVQSRMGERPTNGCRRRLTACLIRDISQDKKNRNPFSIFNGFSIQN